MLLDPSRFYVGETVTWTLSPSTFSQATQDLLLSDGAALRLGIANASSAVAIIGLLPDDEWVFELTVEASASLTAGTYRYQLIALQVTEEGEEEVILARRVEASGYLEVLQLADGSAAVDTRSPDEKILDAIIAVMQGHATTDQASVSIDGTSISRMSWSELIAARSEFERRVYSGAGSSRRRSRVTVTRL